MSSPSHFQGKEALEHVAEAKANGIIGSAEIHGTDLPGHFTSLLESARETAVVMLLIFILFERLHTGSPLLLTLFGFSWLLWKGGRSSLLAWARLERMHRIVEQERYEIQHHRKQERDELKELYRAKGLEGKLLEEVMDVLMADEERLLNIMVEEELCLRVNSEDHPLKQGLFAALGAAVALGVCLIASPFGLVPFWLTAMTVIGISSGFSAYYVGNMRVPALIWNLGVASAAAFSLYFLSIYLRA